MRYLGLGLLALVPALLVYLVMDSRPATESPFADSVPAPVGRTAESAPRLGPHKSDVARLEQELAQLRAEVESLRNELRTSVRARVAPVQGGEASDRRDILASYVDSFADGGTGSEYYRLAVDAFAKELRSDLVRLAGDPTRPLALRTQVLAMLTTPRFRGDSEVIGLLTRLVSQETPESLVLAAIPGLGSLAGPDVAAILAGALPSDPSPAVLRAALLAIAAACGADANVHFARLFDTCTDDKARALILGVLTAADPEAAYKVFAQAFRMSKTVRLAAAQQLARGDFRTDPFKTLVAGLIDTERDPGVLTQLRHAKNAIDTVPRWHPLKATGAADTTDATVDSPTAWAPGRLNAGREWLELTYAEPLTAHAARVFEVCTPGAVVEVEAVDEDGGRHTVWKGQDPLKSPGVFEVTFPRTDYRVEKLRIVLDTSRRSGWNEIDAVELVGPEGRAWAADAIASSWYGQLGGGGLLLR